MESAITFLGDHPFAKDANGKLKARIGTAFSRGNTLVTLPGIHATQRQAYLDLLNQQRQAAAGNRSASRRNTTSGTVRSI